MSKLTKIMHKIFGINADFSYQMGKFGSFKAGSPQYAANVTDIQALSNFEEGLYGSVVGSNAPLLEDFNSALHHSSRQIGYLYQMGIPEWDLASTYYVNSFVSYGGDVFKCLIDGCTNVIPSPSTSTSWEIMVPKGYSAYYYNNAGTVVPSGYSSAVTMSFEVKFSDPKNMVSNPETSWTLTALYSGYYSFSGTVECNQAFASGDYFDAFYTIQGSRNLQTSLSNRHFTGTESEIIAPYSCSVYLAKGDTFRINVAIVRAAGSATFYGSVVSNMVNV